MGSHSIAFLFIHKAKLISQLRIPTEYSGSQIPHRRRSKAMPVRAAQDHVIRQGHARSLANGTKTGGKCAIFSGRRRNPGRVVVPSQGRGCAEAEGFVEELAGADEAGSGRAQG